MTAFARVADPYRDTAVIDARAPRANQAFVAVMTALALLLSVPGLVAVVGAQLITGLTFGRRWCLPCVTYFELIQPRIGEGPIEDARAPRFANVIGAGVLSAATAAFIAGVPALGWALTALVASLAGLAAVSGLCVGCVVHRWVWGCEVCDARVAGSGG